MAQATLQGVNAVDALLNMTPDSPSIMLAKSGNAITRPSLMDCVEKARGTNVCTLAGAAAAHDRGGCPLFLSARRAQTQAASKALEEKRFAEALKLRGEEFYEAHETFWRITLAVEHLHDQHDEDAEQVSARPRPGDRTTGGRRTERPNDRTGMASHRPTGLASSTSVRRPPA